MNSVSATASVMRSAEQSPQTAAKLLKKTMDADEYMVNKLLPLPPPPPGSVDIRA